MQRRPDRYNRKRRIATDIDADQLAQWSERVVYGGNPEHKRNPGDFGLHPPAAPRADKSLCDEASVFQRSEALQLLKEGIKRGLVSVQRVGELPQNVWSVTADGVPMEAQLENRESATYHGYPISKSDPFARDVLAAWSESDD